MSRPLRIEFPGAVFHITSRGDRREPIYRDDADRVTQLAVLDEATLRFDVSVLAYCLMGNHYHLVLCTRSGALSRLMRHLNGVYTQAFNRRHGLVGHLFQGRFKAVLVDSDRYLAALSRYVERNPVAAGLVERPECWPWSSCRAHLGLEPAPPWLAVDELHGFMLGREVATPRDRATAIRRYSALVSAQQEDDADFWAGHLNGQIFLGDEAFAERARMRAAPEQLASPQVPARQRKAMPAGPRTWPAWLALNGGNRDHALHDAYSAGWKTMPALAEVCGLSVAHVSRIIRRVEEEERGET
jgi:REP element-mobilizing transposase RayT